MKNLNKAIDYLIDDLKPKEEELTESEPEVVDQDIDAIEERIMNKISETIDAKLAELSKRSKVEVTEETTEEGE